MIGYLDTFCKGCIYHAKSTRSCDYFIIENRLRGCPGGDGCRARRTKKDVRKAMQPKWDTALGKQMWEEGKTDRQIADHFGIAPNTVLYQRQKKWEKDTTCTPPRGRIGRYCFFRGFGAGGNDPLAASAICRPCARPLRGAGSGHCTAAGDPGNLHRGCHFAALELEQ